MNKPHFTLTREKHLDHMVKVTPFIVGGYLLQCYMIVHLKLAGFATDMLFFLGFSLMAMIAGFITYDLKHKVHFYDGFLEIDWLGKKVISYDEIQSIEVSSDDDKSFGNLKIQCTDSKKYTFYFIDDADKIKQWIKENKNQSSPLAA